MTGEGRHPDRVPMRDAAETLPPPAIGGPIRELEAPIPVTAWLSFPRQGPTRLEAEATAWTPRAGHVRYHDQHGREGNAWVWANAIERGPARVPF